MVIGLLPGVIGSKIGGTRRMLYLAPAVAITRGIGAITACHWSNTTAMMPLQRSNFNKMSGWPRAVESIGASGLHVHDLRHTGNQFAANSGAALKDLMTRMGHDSERAALIYQHEARGADQRITDAIDSHVQAESDQGEDDDDGRAGALVPAG